MTKTSLWFVQFPNQNGGALKLTVCYAKLKHLPLQHYSCSASHWSTALAIFDQVLAWLCHLVGWRYTHLSSGQLHHSGRWMYGEVNSASKPFRVMTNYPPPRFPLHPSKSSKHRHPCSPPRHFSFQLMCQIDIFAWSPYLGVLDMWFSSAGFKVLVGFDEHGL